MSSQSTQSDPNCAQRVVLVHGLGAHWLLMWPLAWYLKRAGFVATTFGYRSWLGSIEQHAKRFEQKLERIERDPEIESFSVVAHSMGGIVARKAILDGKFPKLRRVVQLGPPNHGSPAARRLGFLVPFCKTLRQISDRPTSFVLELPQPSGSSGVEFGIIAAQHDRVIPEQNSHLKTEADHVTIFSGHNGLLVRPTALKQVAAFLSHGRFLR